jgi:hypothetical protein
MSKILVLEKINLRGKEMLSAGITFWKEGRKIKQAKCSLMHQNCFVTCLQLKYYSAMNPVDKEDGIMEGVDR